MLGDYTSLDELYTSIKPALTTKCNEFKLHGLIVNELDIWNYLSNKWRNSIDLDINHMVKDIFDLDIKEMENL